jgi:hypothetical protein
MSAKQKIIPIGEHEELVHDENAEGGVYEEVPSGGDGDDGYDDGTGTQAGNAGDDSNDNNQVQQVDGAGTLFLYDLMDFIGTIDYPCFKSSIRWFMEAASCHISISVSEVK